MAQLVSSLLDPIILFILGVILALMVYWFSSSKKTAGTLALLSFLQLWLLSNPLFVTYLASLLEADIPQYSSTPEDYNLDERPIDYVVIMGGSHLWKAESMRLHMLVDSSLRRIIEAWTIAEEHPQSLLIVSGNHGHQGISANALTELGIAEDRIYINKNVRNTRDEIKSIVDLINNGIIKRESTLMIVSSAAHLVRTAIWVDHYGLEAIYSGADFLSIQQADNGEPQSLRVQLGVSAPSAAKGRKILHEYLGIVQAHLLILMGLD